MDYCLYVENQLLGNQGTALTMPIRTRDMIDQLNQQAINCKVEGIWGRYKENQGAAAEELVGLMNFSGLIRRGLIY